MPSFYHHDDCDIRAFDLLLVSKLSLPSCSPAIDVVHNVPLYHGPSLRGRLAEPAARHKLMAEWSDVLMRQSGIVVIKQAIEDHDVIDAATTLFEDIIEEERGTITGGDHFAGAGANDRIWNSLQKLALADPAVFTRYFSSTAIAGVCEAYLGPAYQMTAQLNVVRPTGRAQRGHRDYHLGFMSADEAARYPTQAHQISAAITLQGAIAHCDMPVLSGPTKLLPFSQLYGPGYLASHQQAFQDRFEERFIQIPLKKGDAIFFCPAVMHAAGDNDSDDIQRMANLLQVSSAMGRPIEQVNRFEMAMRLYPALRQAGLDEDEENAVIAAFAEGYSFPTNLDTDPPVAGLASESQAALIKRALRENMSSPSLEADLHAQHKKRQP